MMEDLSICFCAVHIAEEETQVFVVPLFDNKEGKKTKCEEGSSGSSDCHHQHHTEIKRITPLSICSISPRHLFNFALLDSKLYVIASHVFPHSEPLDPEREKPLTMQFDAARRYDRVCCSAFLTREELDFLENINDGIGCPGRGRHMFHCDLRHPNLGWKQGPLLRGSRLLGGTYPIVVDESIFVIGGNDSLSEPVMEVFDSFLHEWRVLAPPPPQYWREDTEGFPSLSAVVDNPKRIILTTNVAKYFYVYDIKGDCWSMFDIPSSSCRSFILGRAAVAGQTLYWFDYEVYKFIAFDLEENKWIRGRLKGLKTEKDFDSTPDCPVLIHVHGDMFTLLWTAAVNDGPVVAPRNSDSDTDDTDYDKKNVVGHYNNKYLDSHKNRTRIHCAKVRASKIPHVKGKYGLKAYLESCQCYEVDHRVTLLDAFLMENQEKKVVLSPYVPGSSERW